LLKVVHSLISTLPDGSQDVPQGGTQSYACNLGSPKMCIKLVHILSMFWESALFPYSWKKIALGK